MAVYRVHSTKDYTVMSNDHLRNREMSLKAKGLLSVMLSLPDNWDYSIEGLCLICKENETAIKSTLAELKRLGYLTVAKVRNAETGLFEYVYDIFEKSVKQGKNPAVENPAVENPAVENQGQLSTNKSSTNISNTKEREDKRFAPPSLEEVKSYCSERKNNVDAERFIDYYTANGWRVGRNKMKDWRAAVRSWERNDFNKPQRNTGAASVYPFEDEDDLSGIL